MNIGQKKKIKFPREDEKNSVNHMFRRIIHHRKLLAQSDWMSSVFQTSRS